MCLMSVIIPCYNGLESIDLLHKKSIYITENYDIEIIFVDNGSNDGTHKKFKSYVSNKKIKFFSIKNNKGYGYGIKKSINLCNGVYVGWTHADLQTDLFDLIKAYNIIEKNILEFKDEKLIVKGKRLGRPLKDKIFSKSMSIISSILFFPLSTYEICAQPSIFHNSIKEEIQKAPDGYELDVYVFLAALISGFVPRRFPVLFPTRVYGNSHWNINFISKVLFIRRIFFSLLDIFIKKRILSLKIFS